MKLFPYQWSVVEKLIFCFALSTLLLALFLPAQAQQSERVPRIGYLADDGSSPPHAFVQALRDLGYVEGQNIAFEYRTAQGNSEQIVDLAAELVQLNVDSIIADSTNASIAAKKATSTIPIVIMTTTDPVANGLVASLAHPNGNITGLVRLSEEPEAKLAAVSLLKELVLRAQRLALLKEIIPGISRVGILRDLERAALINARSYELVAIPNKIEIQYLDVGQSNPDFETVFEAATKARVNALITVKTPLLKLYQNQISELAAKHGLPLMSEDSDDVAAGSLLSYSANDADLFRRVATYLDKILKGAKPADLAVETWPCVIVRGATVAPPNCEQPTKFELVINLKTAKQIGLTIPPNVLARADRVIK